MADTIFYIPIYKTCPGCGGSGDLEQLIMGNPAKFRSVDCHICGNTGVVQMLLPLDEFAKEIDLSEEATHNLMCYVRDA